MNSAIERLSPANPASTFHVKHHHYGPARLGDRRKQRGPSSCSYAAHISQRTSLEFAVTEHPFSAKRDMYNIRSLGAHAMERSACTRRLTNRNGLGQASRMDPSTERTYARNAKLAAASPPSRRAGRFPRAGVRPVDQPLAEQATQLLVRRGPPNGDEVQRSALEASGAPWLDVVRSLPS